MTATSKVDVAYERIRAGILSGEYHPGSRLRLDQLVAQTRVSLIPVREALRRLEAERLVSIEANVGAYVTEISADDVADTFGTLLVLQEHAILANLAEIRDQRIAQANEYLCRVRESGGVAPGSDQEIEYRAFFRCLVDPAASPWTAHLLDQVWDSAERYMRLLSDLGADDLLAHHERLLDALRAGDAERSAVALRTTLICSEELLIDAFAAP